LTLIKKKVYYLLAGLFCLHIMVVSGQDQKIADSLKIILKEGYLKDTLKLQLLNDLAFNEVSDRDLSLQYAEELIRSAEILQNNKWLANGFHINGSILTKRGNIEAALKALLKSAEISQNGGWDKIRGGTYIAIADVYATIENFRNSTIYYNRAIGLLRKINDSIKLASALLNAGDAYFYTKKYDSALIYNKESGAIFKKKNYLIGIAYTLGNTGMIHAELGEDAFAESNINEAINILEEMGDFYPITVYLTYMSDIYTRKNDESSALLYAKRSLELARKYKLKDEISGANLKLAQLYEGIGNKARAYDYYKDHISYRDSVKNLEVIQQLADQRTNFEVSQKQVEVDLLNQQKKTQKIIAYATGIGLFLVGILAFGLFKRNTFIQKTKKIIEEERDRSDTLLLNILPEETAQELKESGKVKAQKFDSVTVLFTDFKGFTQYSSQLSPEQLVETVSFYFSKFDEIVERHGLEKIKTIGDAYMCAGGLPFPSEDHALKMVKAAFEIAAFVEETRYNPSAVELDFDIRIGINTGPVVAGVVGSKKFAYDIWGDTVNVASRMEAASEAGKINISENTYQLIKDSYKCTYRGELQVKNKGEMKMYFVDSSKEAVKMAAV